jgi:DNA end-binding protein Ku
METLFFADDVRSKVEIEEAVEAVDLKDAELQLAEQVIDSLVGEWNPGDFENEYRRDMKAMLDAKLAGEKITRPEPVAETPVVDLMEALRRSVAEVQDKKGAAKPKRAKAAPKASGPGASGATGSGSRRKASARK